MNEIIRFTKQDAEMADLIGMTPTEYVGYKIRVEVEAPSVRKLEKLFAKHRGKKRPSEVDTIAAHFAIYMLGDLGWKLNRASDPVDPSAS